jgi:hypothetical protein
MKKLRLLKPGQAVRSNYHLAANGRNSWNGYVLSEEVCEGSEESGPFTFIRLLCHYFNTDEGYKIQTRWRDQMVKGHWPMPQPSPIK